MLCEYLGENVLPGLLSGVSYKLSVKLVGGAVPSLNCLLPFCLLVLSISEKGVIEIYDYHY